MNETLSLVKNASVTPVPMTSDLGRGGARASGRVQEREERLGEAVADAEGDRDREQRADEAPAQLLEVRGERHPRIGLRHPSRGARAQAAVGGRLGGGVRGAAARAVGAVAARPASARSARRRPPLGRSSSSMRLGLELVHDVGRLAAELRHRLAEGARQLGEALAARARRARPRGSR